MSFFLYLKHGLFQLARSENQKSIERPVINSFTVIKTLESLKGVRLLMSCDILEAPHTQNCTVTVRYLYADNSAQRKESVHSWAGKKKKK